MKRELIVEQDPKSPISEIFRTLRTNIQFMNTKGKLKTLLITSTFPEEGKSWVASNLAVTFAQAGKRVILVDADMRKGRQYTIFGVSPKPGLSNYLSGIDENNLENDTQDLANYIQETKIKNLYIMPAGNIPPNPSELLISPQMVNLLGELKDLCDIVIIDGTPNELITDSLILARLVDSTLIVAASNETKKDNLKRVITNIQNIGGKIAGVVLNKVPISAKKYEQSYYYGSTLPVKTKNTTNRQRKSNVEYRNKSRNNIIDKNINKKNDREINLSNTERNILREQDINNIQNKNVIKNTEKEDKVLEEYNNYKIDEAQPNRREEILNRNIEIENSEGISLEETNKILQQINEYLDRERKNLNS